MARIYSLGAKVAPEIPPSSPANLELPPSCGAIRGLPELSSRVPEVSPRTPEVASEWYPFSLVEKFYSHGPVLHKWIGRLFSRFFSRPQAVHRRRSRCPQTEPFSTAIIHNSCWQTTGERAEDRGYPEDPDIQKTGMMSSALISSETSTPSMSSSGMAGKSMPHRWTMTRILAMAFRQFSACSS